MLQKYIILIPLILSIYIASINLNKPFIGHHDFMSAFEGTIAKNYLKHGLWETKFGQIPRNVTREEVKTNKSFQVSYLPLLPIFIYISYLLFGISEWSTRIVPAFFSVLGLVFFYLCIKKIWGQKVAFIASIFYILNPMFIYFSKLPAPEPLLVACFGIIFYSYLNWLDKKYLVNFLLVWILIFISGMIGWPILYIGPLLIIHSFINQQFQKKLILLLLPVLLIPLMQFGHLLFLTGKVDELFETLKRRTIDQNLSFGGTDFSWKNYIKQEITWLQSFYTRTAIILSILGVLGSFIKRNRFKTSTIFLFLLFGLSHPILFSKYVFIHDFLNIYLLPFFALCASLGLTFILEFLKNLKVKIFLQFAFALVILITFILERIDFSRALLKTEMNKPGIEMANILNSLESGPKEAVIVSPRFESFFGIFTNFYSNYGFAITDENSLKKEIAFKKYHYLITIDQDIVDKEFYQQLIQKYKSQRKRDLTIINTYEQI